MAEVLHRQVQYDATVADRGLGVVVTCADGPLEDEGLHKIVVVGGGAAGLELVTRLGDRLGRRRRASVTLVESARTHLWKPLLHEVAAGALVQIAGTSKYCLLCRADFRPQAPRSRLQVQLGRERPDVPVRTGPSECGAAARCRRS
jgi:hypothetical protein